MKKFTIVLGLFYSGILFSQDYWEKLNNITTKKIDVEEQYYELNIDRLSNKLKQSKTAKAPYVIIEIPTLEGKLESFKVTSFSVLDKNLESQYNLGSYTGVSLLDPHRTVRFSISPDYFHSMIFDQGAYQFIDPIRNRKGVYRVHLKTKRSVKGKALQCTTKDYSDKHQIELNPHQRIQTSKHKTSDDKQYRVLRLAVSTTGEYTQTFGGVAGALSQINATMTRVNGIFEKDLALHLDLINAPQLIYTNPNTDPYSNPSVGIGDAYTEGKWHTELQKTLVKEIGKDHYDIGHLFGNSDDNHGGGNAGGIGVICGYDKDLGYSAPYSKDEYGDLFDLDIVAHELGHQLGANHTFSHSLELNTNAQIEPGSGSTIMAYAGATFDANVQERGDSYFSIASLNQIQNTLERVTCDVEIPITNNTPPEIKPLNSYTIPKKTAFMLTAEAMDKEGDALTYTWEQIDVAKKEVKSITGNNNQGPNFRSLKPTSNSTRYFPKLETVIEGVLINAIDWEAVSNVPREMNFAVTVRDNNVISTQQQVSTAEQKIIIGDDGPFMLTTNTLTYKKRTPLTWEIANTNNAPYNVKDVKIDYTLDKGKTWNVLLNQTSNDGSEVLPIPSELIDKEIQIRVSAIDNVFYAISRPIKIREQCNTDLPINLNVSIQDRKAIISWDEVSSGAYILRYKKKNENQWIEISTRENSYELKNLSYGEEYEVQVASFCKGSIGQFTKSQDVIIPDLNYCLLKAQNATLEYISKVKIVDALGNIILDNNTDGQGYSDFTNDNSNKITLKKSSIDNKLNISIAYPSSEDYYETLSVWIDFNGDGILSENERIVKEFIPDPSNTNVGTIEKQFRFNVPNDAVVSDNLRMRIALKVGPSINSAPATACDGTLIGTIMPKDHYTYGEVEDYKVNITL